MGLCFLAYDPVIWKGDRIYIDHFTQCNNLMPFVFLKKPFFKTLFIYVGGACVSSIWVEVREQYRGKQDLVYYFQHIPTLVICWSVFCFVKWLKWVTITKSIWIIEWPQATNWYTRSSIDHWKSECQYTPPTVSPELLEFYLQRFSISFARVDRIMWSSWPTCQRTIRWVFHLCIP